MATATELRQQAADFLQERFPTPPGIEATARFSAFRPSQVEEAAQLGRRFSQIAARGPGLEGVGNVLAAAREEVLRRLPGLVKYALLIFLTHDPLGARVGAPTLEERHPRAVTSMVETEAAITAQDSDSLAFFREDVFANDHHAHWHMVYRADWERQERQGEIFLYMHQQMLARYDAERLGVGRAEVAPLDLERGVIEEGYDPQLPGYAARRDKATLEGAAELRGRQGAFQQAVEEHFFERAYEERRFDPSYDPGGPSRPFHCWGECLRPSSTTVLARHWTSTVSTSTTPGTGGSPAPAVRPTPGRTRASCLTHLSPYGTPSSGAGTS